MWPTSSKLASSSRALTIALSIQTRRPWFLVVRQTGVKTKTSYLRKSESSSSSKEASMRLPIQLFMNSSTRSFSCSSAKQMSLYVSILRLWEVRLLTFPVWKLMEEMQSSIGRTVPAKYCGLRSLRMVLAILSMKETKGRSPKSRQRLIRRSRICPLTMKSASSAGYMAARRQREQVDCLMMGMVSAEAAMRMNFSRGCRSFRKDLSGLAWLRVCRMQLDTEEQKEAVGFQNRPSNAINRVTSWFQFSRQSLVCWKSQMQLPRVQSRLSATVWDWISSRRVSMAVSIWKEGAALGLQERLQRAQVAMSCS